MFIGFPPSSKKRYYHNQFLPGHFLVICLEAAKKLQWQIDKVTETGFFAQDIDRSGKTRSVIELKLNDDRALAISRSLSGFIDFGRNAANIRKFNEQIIDLKYDLKPADLERLLELLKADLIQPSEESYAADPDGESSAKSNNVLSLLIPRKGYLITPVLIYLNIILFLVQIITGINIMAPGNDGLILWGGNYRPLTLTGQWWRLLTSCFLHIGVIHLLMNMYALLYIGLLLEPLIGSAKFGYAYLVSGILASVTSVCWHENMISAGASGAIFGMYGVYITMLATNLIEKDVRRSQLSSMAIFIIYNLAYGLKGGIDNAAHIGGLISGILTGFSFLPFIKNPALKWRNTLITASAVLAMALLSFFQISRTSNPIGDYNNLFRRFGELEEKALSVYSMSQYSTEQKILNEIETNGLPNWVKCKSIIDSAAKIDGLPDPLLEQNKLLLLYCDYRIESYKLMQNSIRQQAFAYRKWIEEYNSKIDLILRKLNGEAIEDSSLVVKLVPIETLHYGNGFYVVDGKPVMNIDFLKESDIREMTVLKGESAVALYGENAREGAIIINTWSGMMNSQ